MKILLVSHSQKTGGAERCLVEAAVGLQRKGYHVHVLVPADAELSVQLKKHEIAFSVRPYPWWVYTANDRLGLGARLKRVASSIWYGIRLLRTFRAIDPDVVISNTVTIAAPAIAAKLTGKRHMWFIHEYGEEDHRLTFDLGFYLSSKIISFTSEHIFVNSAGVQSKYLRHIRKSKFSIVNYDIQVPSTEVRSIRFAPVNNEVNILLVGQISSNKGQMDALEAVRILNTRGYLCKIWIVGQVAEEWYYQSLMAYVAGHSLGESITFVKHTDAPYQFAHDFTIGLMCSQWEALGRVTIEYMKLGIPVIGADSSATSTLIRHRSTGLLYELRNPESLANEAMALIQDPQLVAGIIENARRFASENFNSEKFINTLVAPFKDLS